MVIHVLIRNKIYHISATGIIFRATEWNMSSQTVWNCHHQYGLYTSKSLLHDPLAIWRHSMRRNRADELFFINTSLFGARWSLYLYMQRAWHEFGILRFVHDWSENEDDSLMVCEEVSTDIRTCIYHLEWQSVS